MDHLCHQRFGIACPPMAFVPAAGEGIAFDEVAKPALFSMRREALMLGMTAVFANQGVAQTDSISRSGSSAFVMA